MMKLLLGKKSVQCKPNLLNGSIKGLGPKVRFFSIALFLFTLSFSVQAAHFRYGSVTATKISETTTTVSYRLNVSLAWQTSPAPSVNFTISGGNTGSVIVQMTNTTDPGGWINGTGSGNVTLNKTTTPTRLTYSGGNKISNLVNNANGSWNIYTILNTSSAGNTPVTTLPAIINMPVNASAATYTIPASDPDPGSTLTYGLATITGLSNPSGLSINSTTGQITFDTRGKSLNQLYNALVTVTDNNGNQIMLDFIIKIVAFSNPPAFDYAITPPNGSTYTVLAGQNISYTLRAVDTDINSTVNLSVSGLPSYITAANFSPSLPATGNPSQTTFSWTPTTAQTGNTVVINFIATDNVGVQTTTSVTMKVAAEPAPVFSSVTPSSGSIRQILTGVLHKDTISASSPLGSNVSIAYSTGVPTAAQQLPTVPTAAANPAQTILSWTPTPADFGQRTITYQAVISSVPTIFSTRSYDLIVNTPPTFSTAPPSGTVLAGTPYSYDVTLTDPDVPYGDVLNVVAADLPSWLSLSSLGNGRYRISGTPTVADAGSYHFHLHGEDIYHHGNPEEVEQHAHLTVLGCTAALSTTVSNVTCPNTNDGAINLSVAGGTAPFSYLWSNGATTKDLINLPAGNYTVTVTDANNCSVSTSIDVGTDVDQTPPVITLNGSSTITHPAFTSYTDLGAIVTDNCSATLVTSGLVDINILGNYTITYTATDASGNVTTASRTITVHDVIPPNVITKNLTINVDATGTAAITPEEIDGGTRDDSGRFTLSLDKSTFSCEDIAGKGSNKFSLNYDGNDNVIVSDAPGLRVTGDITVEAWFKMDSNPGDWVRIVGKGSAGPRNYGLWYHPGGTFLFQQYGGGGEVAAGRPVIPGRWYHVAGVRQGTQARLYIDGVLVASGGASSNAPSVSADPLTIGYSGFHASHRGQIDEVRIWNTARTSQQITAHYNIALNGTETGLVAYYNMEDGQGTVLKDVTGHGYNGSLQSFTQPQVWSASSSALSGANSSGDGVEVTLTATDPSGNSSSKTAVITVEDKIAPTIVSKPVSVTLTSNGTVSITPQDVLQSGTDNCAGVITYILSKSVFASQDARNTPVTVQLTGTDVSGNVTTVPVQVTVIDPVPVVLTKNITVLLDAYGQATITAGSVDNGSSSVVGLASLTLDKSAFSCENIGTNTVTLTATSTLGSSASATAIVTVEDKVPPVAIAKNLTLYLNTSGIASITAAAVNNGSTDNCGIASLSISKSAFSGADLGVNQVTLTVKDNSNNISTATATVTVLDTIAPTVSAQHNIIVDLNSQCTTTLADYRGNAGVNDNSTPASQIVVTQLPAPGTVLSGTGTLNVTFTAKDLSGNIATTTFVVTKRDIIAPTVLAKNYTASLNANGQATVSVNDVNNGSYDQCSPVALTFSNNGKICAIVNEGGLLTLTAPAGATITSIDFASYGTATGECGNFAYGFCNASNSMTLVKNAFLGKNSGSISATNSVFGDPCGGTFKRLVVQASYTISGVSANGTELAFDCSNVGPNTVTLIGTDQSGNVSSTTAVVIVQDKVAPIALAQNVTVQLNASGVGSTTAAAINNGSTDACGIKSLAISKSTFTCENIGDNTVTLTVTDKNNNVSTASAIVTVEDKVAPVAIAKNITIQLDANGAASTTAAAINNGSTDACGIKSMVISKSDFTCENIGPNEVVLTVTDNHGNVSTANAIVTVEDKVAPVAIAQNVTVQLNAQGVGSTTAGAVNYGSSDACGIASITLSKTNFDCSNVGANEVVLTVTDVNGNVSTANATVTVEDKVAPVALAQNITVQLNASGVASITAEAVNYGSTDACGIASITLSKTNFDCSNVGANEVVLTVTDSHGNVSTANAIVTVEDKVAPVALAQNVTVQLNSSGVASITAEAVNYGSTDACGIASITLSKTDFDCSNAGANEVVLTVTDNHGNVSTANAIVTVEDKVAPVALAQNVTVQLNSSGVGSTTAEAVNYGSSDACGIASIVLSKTDFDCSNVGANEVVLTVTDNHGNVSTANAIVTVEDKVAPVALAQNVTVQLNASGVGSTTAAAVNYGSTDACGIASITLSKTDFDCSNVGANEVVLTVTDVNGNVSTANAIVTVEDKVAPVALAQNITIQLNASGVASTTAAAVNNGSSDACGIASIVLSKTDFNCSNVGANEVVLTVTDVNGNLSTANAIVTVEDKVAPVALAQNVTVQLNASGVGSTSAEAVNYASSDACGIASITLSKTNFDCSNVGANEVVLTVTDVNGNVSTANAIVTVEDKVAPVVLTKNITIQLDANGAASITDQSVNNGSSDNCGIQSVVVSKKSFDCSNVGANTVTLTVTDIHGNVSSANATVTVEDKVAPIAIAKNLTINLVGGVANITPEMVNNGSSDACGIKSLELSRTGFDCSSIGNHTVTLTVTDKNNNVSTTTAVVTIVGEISGSSIVSLPTSNTYTGGNANNLYLGYGAQSTTLKVTPSVISGNGTIRSYTYVWSGSAVSSLSSTTSATPVFTPTVAGNYNFTVTVTNAYGCKTSSSIAICVKDIREVDKKGAYTGKVFVCHVPNGDMSKANTLSISPSAVAAHLGNHDGDKLGTCDQQCGTAANTIATTNDVSEVRLENSIQIAQSSLTAYPNPFAMQTTVEFKVAQDQQKVSVEVYDLKGVKVKTIYSGPAKAGSVNTTSFDGSYLAPGVYFFRLITPTEALNFKAIKTE